MLDTRHLAVLAALTEEGRFDRAATRLGITQSAVSQRLKALELQAGGPLVVRETPPRLTAQGQELLAHFLKVQAMEQALTLHDKTGAGPKRMAIAANADSVATWLLDVLAPLGQAGEYLFDIRIDDQDVTQDLLKQGEVLGCISATERPVSGCRSWSLGNMTYHLWASPGYMARWFPNGWSPERAARAPLLVYNRKDELQDRFLADQMSFDAAVMPRHWLPSSHGFVEAIARGFGCGMAPVAQIQQFRDAGQLVEVVPGRAHKVPLFWQAWDLKGSSIDAVSSRIIAMKDRLDDHLSYPMT